MPPSTNKSTRKSRKYLLLIIAVWLVVATVLALHRQGLYDWWRLRSYTAPTAVSQLADDDALTPSARRIFYVNQPLVAVKTAFADKCPRGTEQTVVLGCYQSNQAGIYILQVNDSRLNGIEQVTAAHELLHAAYDRLSAHERQEVDGWLEDYYQHDLTDQTIKALIADYQKSEPHDVVNEMHSVFGTQVANLPPQLEQYYQRYFTNRASIVQYYNTYEAEFTDRQNTIKADEAQLKSWQTQISSDETSLRAQSDNLRTRQAQLQTLRSSNSAAYNQAVPGYNADVSSFKAQVAAYQDLIDQYNSLVGQLNAVVLETQQLTQEITGQPIPSPGQ